MGFGEIKTKHVYACEELLGQGYRANSSSENCGSGCSRVEKAQDYSAPGQRLNEWLEWIRRAAERNLHPKEMAANGL